jgi:hypothetical protein
MKAAKIGINRNNENNGISLSSAAKASKSKIMAAKINGGMSAWQ